MLQGFCSTLPMPQPGNMEGPGRLADWGVAQQAARSHKNNSRRGIEYAENVAAAILQVRLMEWTSHRRGNCTGNKDQTNCGNLFVKRDAPTGNLMYPSEKVRAHMSSILKSLALSPGRFGPYGGRYVPETSMVPLFELEHAYEIAKSDANVQARLSLSVEEFCRPPHSVAVCRNAHRETWRATNYLKREDLLHTGAHKINNAIGQGLLAVKMGKPRIVAETVAGQHGVASATVAAHLGLECTVYMGTEDMARQALNVARMRMLGAQVDRSGVWQSHAEGRHQRSHARLGYQRSQYALSSRVGAGRASLPHDGA